MRIGLEFCILFEKWIRVFVFFFIFYKIEKLYYDFLNSVSSATKLQQAHEELDRRGGEEAPDHLQANVVSHGLDTIWKMGKIEVCLCFFSIFIWTSVLHVPFNFNILSSSESYRKIKGRIVGMINGNQARNDKTPRWMRVN